LKPRTVEDYEWALTCHLLPFFARHRLDAITVEDVDRYRAAKVREGRLTSNVVNKTLTRLAQVLEVAVEYGYLDRNPARGRRRRLKATTPKRTWLETLAGLRIGELLALRWRDVDLATGKLRVGEAKTDAGRRTVDLSPALRDELAAHKARTPHAEPESLVFCTRTGQAQNRNNVRRRILLAAVERANTALSAAGEPELPEGLSPQALRHTFALSPVRGRGHGAPRHGPARPRRPEGDVGHLCPRSAPQGRHRSPHGGSRARR
jgi:integrase